MQGLESEMAYRPGEDIAAILEKIRNPLVFYALSLLVTESILYLGLTNIDENLLRFYLVLVMAFLFLVVIGIVGFITFYVPEHLYEQIAERLRPHVIEVLKPEVITAVQEKAAEIDERAQIAAEYSDTITTAITAFEPIVTPQDRDDAIKKLLAISAKHPTNRKIHIMLGRLYRRGEKYDEAVRILAEFLRAKEARGQMDKDYADALYNRACYICLKASKLPQTEREKYKQEAYQDLEKSFQISPENKIDAAVDDDFLLVKNEDRFRKLIGSN